MDIDLTNFTKPQQQALFDLLILSMYADGHLTKVEDEILQTLLAKMGFTEEFEQEREYDAAVRRVRPCIQSLLKAKDQAILLASAFTDRAQQKQVYAAVQQIITTDHNVSTWENTLLTELGSQFRM